MTIKIDETQRQRLDRLCKTARAASERNLGVFNTARDLEAKLWAQTQYFRAVHRFEKWDEKRKELNSA